MQKLPIICAVMNLPSTPFRFLYFFAKKQWPGFLFLLVSSTIWAISDSFFPYCLKLIINHIANFEGARTAIFSAISGALLILILFWVSTEVLLRGQGIAQIYIFPKFRAQIRSNVFQYVKSHSHNYFSENFAGNLAKKLADLPTSCQSLLEIICYQFITVIVGAALVLIMMFSVQPIFAGILLVWLCLHFGIALLMVVKSKKLWEIHADSASLLTGKIVDTFSNILNVRLFSRHRYEMEYLQEFQSDEISKAKKAMWLVEKMRMGLGLSGLFLIFTMVFTLIEGWIHGWVSLGDFTQISMQSFWLLGWMWFVSFQMIMFSRELGTISDSLNLIKKNHDLVDITDASKLRVTAGNIEFTNVNFAYPKSSPVFTDLNIQIKAGEKIGLVGFSGSGKTTFVSLLLRFYDVLSGKILIDKQSITDVTQESLRQQIAMIPQDPTLFHRTLMENIRYGRLDASDDEVIEAAKIAHCHEFIQLLDQKYDSLVGERGIKLSGGQRQRIAIARAILKNAPILILDEATSALDTVTEKLIQEGLQHLMKNKTTIVIAHRLSTLSDMDRILVFDKGKIIEDGNQEQLLKHGGHFSQLWEMQVNEFLPDKGMLTENIIINDAIV